MKTLALLCIVIFVFPQIQKEQKFYNTIIITAENVVLDHGQTLLKGEYVQAVIEKSSEEGRFIRTRKDSGLVYYKDIADIVFLKDDIEVKDIKSNKPMKLTKNTPLILLNLKKGTYLVEYNDKKFNVKSKLLYFHNKDFYNSILK